MVRGVPPGGVDPSLIVLVAELLWAQGFVRVQGQGCGSLGSRLGLGSGPTSRVSEGSWPGLRVG